MGNTIRQAQDVECAEDEQDFFDKSGLRKRITRLTLDAPMYPDRNQEGDPSATSWLAEQFGPCIAQAFTAGSGRGGSGSLARGISLPTSL